MASIANAGVSKKLETEHSSIPWSLACWAVTCAILLCFGADAFFDRDFSRNLSDGAAYLDISHSIAQGQLSALLNTYWSPGYPVALFAGLAILHPDPARELAAVYAINWAIGVLAFGCFLYFLTGIPAAKETDGPVGLTRPMLLACGCALFLLAIQADAPVAQITPDLLLSAWLWMAGGAFLRIALRQRKADYVLLGLALSLAYFTKVVALPLAAVAFILLLFTGTDRKTAIRGTLLYFVIFVALIGPYVVKMSAAKGRFTFGESGSLNYAWIVDGSNRWEIQNDSPHGHARLHLVHPARRLVKYPAVFEFGSPVPGSFPIFNDPSYWDDGLKPVFYWKGEAWHLAMNAYHTMCWLARRGEFVLALFVLLAFSRRHLWSRPAPRVILPVLFWFASLWGLYLLVDVEDRYVFAALTSMLLLGAAMIALPDSVAARKAIGACTLILVLGVAVRGLEIAGEKVFYGVKLKVIGIGATKASGFGPYESPYWSVAETLKRRVGLQVNASVACLQMGCQSPYWARLAGVRITADIPNEVEYWGAKPQDRANAIAALSKSGVKALIARSLGPGAEGEGWIPLGEGLYARFTNLQPLKSQGLSQ